MTSAKTITHDGIEFPYIEMSLEMTNSKNLYSRKAYTLFDLLGDFGGFNEAFFMIIGSVLAVYSARLYEDSISRELPFQRSQLNPVLSQRVNQLIETQCH